MDNNFYQLKEYADKYRIELDDRKIEQFKRLYDMMINYNSYTNITRITEEKEVMIKHYLDSLTALCTGYMRENAKVIDIGGGAGFPTLPLAITNPNLDITMLEATEKKVEFVRQVINELGIPNVTVIHGRAEEYGKNKEFREMFDIGIARAVADMSVLSEYVLPFISVSGYFLAMKTIHASDEVKNSEKSIELLGGCLVDEYYTKLPEYDVPRSIYIVKKTNHTPSKYPRRIGKPTKDPLK